MATEADERNTEPVGMDLRAKSDRADRVDGEPVRRAPGRGGRSAGRGVHPDQPEGLQFGCDGAGRGARDAEAGG
jgi:hypothetical protein